MKTALEFLIIGLIVLTIPRQPAEVFIPTEYTFDSGMSGRQSRLENNTIEDSTDDDNGTIQSEGPQSEVDKSAQPLNPTPQTSQGSNEQIIGNKIVTKDGKEFPLRTYKPLLAPDDPDYNQWWVQSINLDEAWDTPVGPNQTILAVIDTGFALNHEEFTNRWFENSGETGPTISQNASDLNCTDQAIPLTEACNNIDDNGDGINDNEAANATTIENPSQLNCTDQSLALDKSCNLIDDDSNDLVDDWRGWDFINHDRSVQAGEMNPDGTGTHHGSYVSGAAAATGNNGVGIAGVDWSTKILPIQALDDDSFGHTLSVARSVRYAAEMGADVISISLGSSFTDSYLRSAIADAVAAGSIVVAASGNDGCDCLLYPANFPEVVAVGALTSSNTPASFSNYGNNLDIMAPGVSIFTTNWTKGNATSAYSSVSGTSLAAPIVAGLMTRMRSYQPDASAQQIVAAVQEQSDRLSLATNQNRSNTLGFGKIVANAAMQRISGVRTLEQAISFDSISRGSNFHPAGKQAVPYDCAQESLQPTTPIYTMTKGSLRLFTLSEVERASLETGGYSANLLAYTCLLLPDDITTDVRVLNPHKEFFNSTYKE